MARGVIAIVSGATKFITDTPQILRDLYDLNIVDAVQKFISKRNLDRWFAEK